MSIPLSAKLPIHDVIEQLCEALNQNDSAVLSAPPGAGKTTHIPLVLIKQDWCVGKIIMFEPRRMAARSAAIRMAQLLGEPVGLSIGYRIRGETKVSHQTRIEVVTGGVLARMLIDDPGLEGYSAVILDEFHERNLDADLSLALTIAGRALFRSTPLKLLVMSATLDAQAIVNVLDNAPYIISEGKMYPVDIIYTGNVSKEDLIQATAKAVLAAQKQHSGHILVFLPGQREIHGVQNALTNSIKATTCILPLYGNLSLEQQQNAIAPLTATSPFIQKVILATDIAETSLTIDGITVVIDGGYHRAPVFDARTSMTRLQTQKISAASATQRAGRAGRTSSGTCYRLWAKEQTLNQHGDAEITQADLAPLALFLSGFGVSHPSELTWLTPPPDNAYKHALKLLADLGAIDSKSQNLTKHGEQLLRAPTHPRLAHMMVLAETHNLADMGATVAALLSENHSLNISDDLEHTLELLKKTKKIPVNLINAKRQFINWLPKKNKNTTIEIDHTLGLLIAAAYPDRIAQQTSTAHIYRLSNGRQARIREHSPLQNNAWLAVAELGGQVGRSEDIIYSAAAITPNIIREHLGQLIETKETGAWSEQHNRFVAECIETVGATEISKKQSKNINNQLKTKAISQFIINKRLSVLPWTETETTLCARVECIRATGTNHNLPDMSTGGLIETAEQWLEPYLNNVSTLADIQKIDLHNALTSLLPWPLLKHIDELAPTHIKVPSGSNIRLHYETYPPILAVKLQEMFGCKTTPTINNGKLALTIHLLSPAKRPLQITQDLAGFWQTSYNDVKKEMKGRYPKHPWPDDPTQAVATRFTKKRFESR